MLTQAATDVLHERERQVLEKGCTHEIDDSRKNGELALAASCYAIFPTSYLTGLWPMQESWWKPKGYRRNLVRAGALLLAEIERLDRAEARREKAEP